MSTLSTLFNVEELLAMTTIATFVKTGKFLTFPSVNTSIVISKLKEITKIDYTPSVCMLGKYNVYVYTGNKQSDFYSEPIELNRAISLIQLMMNLSDISKATLESLENGMYYFHDDCISQIEKPKLCETLEFLHDEQNPMNSMVKIPYTNYMMRVQDMIEINQSYVYSYVYKDSSKFKFNLKFQNVSLSSRDFDSHNAAHEAMIVVVEQIFTVKNQLNDPKNQKSYLPPNNFNKNSM